MLANIATAVNAEVSEGQGASIPIPLWRRCDIAKIGGKAIGPTFGGGFGGINAPGEVSSEALCDPCSATLNAFGASPRDNHTG